MTDWEIKNHSVVNSGKVRNVYLVPGREDLLGILTTDNVSAFDEVVGEIPGRGLILNRMSNYWKNVVSNSSIIHTDSFPVTQRQALEFFDLKSSKKCEGRLLLVKKACVIPIECIVRGYITGSLWKDYLASGRAQDRYFDNFLPSGLLESERLPVPFFTPTTKAPKGHHDKPIDLDGMEFSINCWLEKSGISLKKTNYSSSLILVEKLRSVSLEIYTMASRIVFEKGVIIADTKFEFGFVWNESQDFWDLCLVDEVLTPDSSRFWSVDGYKIGGPQNSFDKQVLRDWLIQNPGQKIPGHLKTGLCRLYSNIYDQLC